MINNFLQTDPGLGFQTKADSVRSTPWKKNVKDDQQMMGRGRGLSNARVWPFAWKSEQQVQARDKRMKEALVVKILSVFGLAGLGRGNMLMNSLLPTSTVLFLARPALGIVLSNNNQRGGSFSNRVKSNLPSLNVSFWIWHWRNEPWTL